MLFLDLQVQEKLQTEVLQAGQLLASPLQAVLLLQVKQRLPRVPSAQPLQSQLQARPHQVHQANRERGLQEDAHPILTHLMLQVVQMELLRAY